MTFRVFNLLCMIPYAESHEFLEGRRSGMPRNSIEGWGVAAMAILFSAIPIFYDFDFNEINQGPSHWGLVDNFQAGIAALAVAGFVKSLKVRSLA